MKGFKNITAKENLVKILKIEARRLGYKSIGSYLEALNSMRTKTGFSKLDLEILGNYGLDGYLKMTESIVTVMGKSDKECLKKLGLENAKKVSESTEKSVLKIKKMPKSSEFFEDKKEK